MVSEGRLHGGRALPKMHTHTRAPARSTQQTWMSETRGDTTMVTPGDRMAGSW